jgi:hypothetical protein
MKTERMIEILTPATKFRIAGKYARNAIDFLKRGFRELAYHECLDGHFVAAENGDTNFLPVILALEKEFPISCVVSARIQTKANQEAHDRHH